MLYSGLMYVVVVQYSLCCFFTFPSSLFSTLFSQCNVEKGEESRKKWQKKESLWCVYQDGEKKERAPLGLTHPIIEMAGWFFYPSLLPWLNVFRRRSIFRFFSFALMQYHYRLPSSSPPLWSGLALSSLHSNNSGS